MIVVAVVGVLNYEMGRLGATTLTTNVSLPSHVPLPVSWLTRT
jgi:hypothetical protein